MEAWDNRRVVLFLEKCHWESTVFVNEKEEGSCNNLSTPHEYDVTSLLVPARSSISVSIDMKDMKEDRLASKQLLRSILPYMKSDSFIPGTKIDLNLVRSLTRI